MIASISAAAAGFSALFCGLAVGAAWVAGIAAPNASYDRLDASRADGHVRQLLLASSAPIAGLFLAAAAFAVLGGALASAILSGVAALGFFSNRWTLAPRRRGKTAPGVRQRRKSQRIVAVSLTLMFAAVGAVAGALAIFKV